jgi:hypothetical protein
VHEYVGAVLLGDEPVVPLETEPLHSPSSREQVPPSLAVTGISCCSSASGGTPGEGTPFP